MQNPPRGKTGSYSVFLPKLTVSFSLSVAENGLECILGAAYLMMDRAFVSIEGDRGKKLEVFLKSKAAADAPQLEGLARAFLAELETQKVRWALSKNNRPIRQYIVEQAVLLGGDSGSGAPGPREGESPS
jgi:His-Xaa-Ser system protein HxsD